MESSMSFGEILEEVDKLPIIDQESLKDILAKRIIERRREQLACEIKEARAEYETGGCRPVSTEDLISEIMS